MAKKKSTSQKPVTSHKHKDKRKNIPTRELRDFVAEDERTPRVVEYPGLLYARDPSLDPQLVWKGKDEQDQKELAVPAVPIYIQEKIHPRAVIEDLKKVAKEGAPAQADLFSDFNGIAFEDQIDFYHHEQNWSNRMILGDSLLAMTSLAEKEGLKGKVQMIYIDPPYGIKFASNWQVSTRKRDVKDRAEDATREPEQIRAFRDTWKLGIHSYLAYLRDRLIVARELLTETGSVFVQIGDDNVHLVRCLLDEVFGSENFISLISYKTTQSAGARALDSTCDYIIWYAKNSEQVKFRNLYKVLERGEKGATRYNFAENVETGEIRRIANDENIGNEGEWRYFTDQGLTSRGVGSENSMRHIIFEGQSYLPPAGHWRTSAANIEERLIPSGRVIKTSGAVRFKKYFDDFGCLSFSNLWDDVGGGIQTRDDPKVYVVQTSTTIIQRCLLMTTDPGDLVLDPTCGSGTTAFVAEQWGRRWITMDTSRVSIALARTRLMAAKYTYYLLADTPEGVKKETEITGKIPPDYKTEGDIKKGFAYKKVPHVTLKAIANNPEIDTIHAKWQEKLEPILAELNRLRTTTTDMGEIWFKIGQMMEDGKTPRTSAAYSNPQYDEYVKKWTPTPPEPWEVWEVPREPEDKWTDEAKKLLSEWWTLRQERQREIDDSIARNSDTEVLYDQPYEDKKRIRVSGPFTVESLSPHRVLSTDEERPASEAEGRKASAVGQFETMIVENLKKAGVKTTVKAERLKFDRLESYAGTWINAEGEYTENGKSRRVAVCIGPEHGAVGTDLIKEAAKEAVQGVGFDLLIVCGFAFDPHVSEEAKRYGKLKVWVARMNPDLAMGDELLKKTGAGNLFMVFGEPDVDIKKQKDRKVTVEIKGVDIYDPTTGQIRNSSTEDIACWFIDTNYNGESFFVRQAYFTGADQPYDKLKRALRAEIDEAAWSTLYSTVSRPFDPPKSGKIAIKVINHYGDEVLKVFEVS